MREGDSKTKESEETRKERGKEGVEQLVLDRVPKPTSNSGFVTFHLVFNCTNININNSNKERFFATNSITPFISDNNNSLIT